MEYEKPGVQLQVWKHRVVEFLNQIQHAFTYNFT